MPFVTVSKINESFLHIDADRSILAELDQHFKFRPHNYQFHPKFKNRMWDGYIHIFNQYNQTLPAGLIGFVEKFCVDNDLSLQVFGDCMIRNDKICTPKDIEKVLDNELKLPDKFDRRDYQMDAASYAINHGRGLLLSATGSGKSLLQYILIRFYQDTLPPDKKLLIVVPTTSLCFQMLGDFQEYSENDETWDAEDNCHIIMSGKEKDSSKQVYISTWQSLFKMPKKYFEQFGFLNIDECHLAEAKSLKKIVDSSINCKYRFGTTGTLKDCKTHKLVLTGMLGPVRKVASTKELIDRGILSELKIECVWLQYPESERKQVKNKKWQEEVKWAEAHQRRLKFISRFGDTMKDNTLILFRHKEHGKAIFNSLKDAKCVDELYYVDGDVSPDEREEIRKACEQEGKTVFVVASYKTFSTGINIKNLHNIIFAAPGGKALVTIIQSIGRGLRQHVNKKRCLLIDLCDDLRIGKWINYCVEHAKAREILYVREGHNYKKRKVKL